MTVITETVLTPGDTPLTRGTVRIDVVGPDARPTTAFRQDGTVVHELELALSAAGVWARDLDPVSDLTPEGVVYRRRAVLDGRTVASDTFTVPDDGGPFELGSQLVDPPGALPTAALSAHEADQTAHGDPLAALDRHCHWYTLADWDRWTQVPITNIIGTTGLGVEPGGIGTATSIDEHGSDRQIMVLDGFEATDMEIGVEFAISSGGTQLGLAMRIGETGPGFTAAVMPWSNVFFGVNSNILPGIWEWDGDQFLNTNQQPGALPSIEQPIVSAVGDGTTVTVRTLRPHLLSEIQGNAIRAHFGPYSDPDFLATAMSATTFTFADTEIFDVTEGSWSLNSTVLPASVHRGFAARVVGEHVTYRQWFPDFEAPPSWTDPLRTFNYEVPTPLASGRSLPASGGVGLMFGHLGNTGRVIQVNDFYARTL